jgi:threonyl-tRNA synthetase
MAERGELAALSARGVPSKFKLDIVQNIPEGEAITLFRNGDFTDLCAGPHVMRTGNIGAFKLTHVASAYYKGDERNPQLQRIYGTAFKNKTAMEEYFAMLEEAKKRDHRRIGAEMGLYAIDSEFVGPGMPLWLPKGAVLVEELERLAKETEFAAGYVRVRTPHLAKEKMYKTSGHLPYYAESMFPPMELKEGGEGEGGEAERYYLKAMNCPHHHRIFAAEPKSYRDLPLRLAEYGCCYRYEQSGELFGLMRVRSLNMNDAHIYCTEEQFAEEFRAVNEMYLRYFSVFGLEKYQMRFSTHDPAKLGQKFVDEPELWVKTEDMVRRVLVESGINFVEVPNEAAFYGPKIDVQVWSAIGREFTIATNQVDFAVPAKFGLRYRDRDNSEKVPLCIHRAPLGTHERFIGFLIEHYAGNFPLWLAPEQVRVVTLNADPALVDYAEEIRKQLRAGMVRAEADFGTDPVKAKIAEAEKARVHTMLVIGPRDMEAGNVSVRLHGKGNLGARPKDEVLAEIFESIRERRG